MVMNREELDEVIRKRKIKLASVNQEQVEEAPVLIVACSNTSRSVGRYGERGREFYSIIDGAFASLLILLTATNEGLGASFVGAFNDKKVSEILGLPEHVRPIGIIALGYPGEKPARLERIQRDRLVHYERWYTLVRVYMCLDRIAHVTDM